MIGLKKAASFGRPSALGDKAATAGNDDGRRQNVGREIGIDLLQALESGENRNRRRNDGVTREQGHDGDARRNAIGVFFPRAR